MKVHLHIERLVVDASWSAGPGEVEAAIAESLAGWLGGEGVAPAPAREHVSLLHITARDGAPVPALGEALGRVVGATLLGSNEPAAGAGQ